jgi:hypothetical protein
VAINYGRVRFIGNVILASAVAVLPTFLIYLATHQKPESLLSFFPLAIAFTLIWSWADKKEAKRTADEIRRRYESGEPPVGH